MQRIIFFQRKTGHLIVRVHGSPLLMLSHSVFVQFIISFLQIYFCCRFSLPFTYLVLKPPFRCDLTFKFDLLSLLSLYLPYPYESVSILISSVTRRLSYYLNIWPFRVSLFLTRSILFCFFNAKL